MFNIMKYNLISRYHILNIRICIFRNEVMALDGVVMIMIYIRISEYDIKLIDVTVYRQDMIFLCHDNRRTRHIIVIIWFCNV